MALPACQLINSKNEVMWKKGFMSSIAVSGYGFGSLIWIPLETAYVNPKNIDPIAVDLNATNSDK
jgi:hypothetical protein